MCFVILGGPKWEPTQLSFVDTVNAKQGDAGSKVLPPRCVALDRDGSDRIGLAMAPLYYTSHIYIYSYIVDGAVLGSV